MACQQFIHIFQAGLLHLSSVLIDFLLISHLDFNRWNRFPFLNHLVTKANAVEEETTWAACLHHQHNKNVRPWLCDSDVTSC